MILFAVVCIFAIVSPTKALTEHQIRRYLNDVDLEYKQIHSTMKDAFWKGQINYAISDLDNLKHFVNKVHGVIKNVSIDNFRNENLKQQVKNLKNIGTFALVDSDWSNLESVINQLKNLGTTKVLCPSTSAETECDLALKPDIKSILETTEDINELQHYWLEFRDQLGQTGKQAIIKYILNYNKSVELNGGGRPSHQYYYHFNNPNFIYELERAVNGLMPLYKELHAYVRNVIWRKFGYNAVSNYGPIPQHLLEKVMVEAWKTGDSWLSRPFPNKKLPNMKTQLIDKGYTPFKVVEKSDEFFRSLGFSALPNIFWNKYLKRLPRSEAGSQCRAKVYDFAPDVGLAFCPSLNFKTFLQMHGDMAVLRYTAERNQLQYGLNNEPCVGFSKALGLATMMSVSTPKHFEAIEFVSNYTFDHEANINRLMRLGMHTIFAIPAHFVHEKLFVNMLDSRVSANQYNCEYWRLMDRHMGVEPPQERNNTNFDVPISFYDAVDPKKPHTARLVAEILGFQIYKGLCDKINQANVKNPFQNCDFFQSTVAGNELKRIMSLGAKKSWKDIIQPLTHTRKLDIQPILDFFEPLRLWLVGENARHGVLPGWGTSRRCRTY